MVTSTPALLTIDQARAELNIGRSLFLELVYSGQIPSIRLGRRRLISASALAEYVRCLELEAADGDGR